MKKMTIGIMSLFLISIFVTSAFAFGGFRNRVTMKSNEVMSAIEAGDYEAFKAAMSDEESFNEMVERFQNRDEHKANCQEMKENLGPLIEQGYESWKEADIDCPMKDKINEENWDDYVELYQAKEKIHELHKKLGFEDKAFMSAENGFMKGKNCMHNKFFNER